MARSKISKEPLPFSPRRHRAREIHWHHWGEEAFSAARSQDRPILLYLTGWWCLECQRMDETAFSDPRIVQKLRSNFVAIRVDSDRRPDVNDRYTVGGWPTVAILTPAGDLLTAGGEMAPNELADLLDRVIEWYRSEEAELRLEIANMEARRQELLRYTVCPPDQPTPELAEEVARELLSLYDPLYGGFGDQPKFPNADAVRLALHRSRLPGGERWREIATKALDSMASGLLDRTEGGFFRSTARRDWTDPHTEKLLDVNSDLTALYLEAFRETGRGDYLSAAELGLAYMEATLRNPDTPTFAGGQAADPNYYPLDLRERRSTTPPAVDRTVFAEGNARAAITYLLAFETLGGADRLETAERTLDFIWTRMADPQQGTVRYWDGQPGGPRLLRDQVWLASAMAAAYDATAEVDYLEKATLLADTILRDFLAQPGGFYDVRAEPGALGGLANRQWNLVENSHAAIVMSRLARFGADGRYLEAARSALALFSPEYHRFGPLIGSYALALEGFFSGKA